MRGPRPKEASSKLHRVGAIARNHYYNEFDDLCGLVQSEGILGTLRLNVTFIAIPVNGRMGGFVSDEGMIRPLTLARARASAPEDDLHLRFCTSRNVIICT